MLKATGEVLLPHFQDEKTEAQRGQLAHPRTHSSHVAELRHHLLGGHTSMHQGSSKHSPKLQRFWGKSREVKQLQPCPILASAILPIWPESSGPNTPDYGLEDRCSGTLHTLIPARTKAPPRFTSTFEKLTPPSSSSPLPEVGGGGYPN